MPQPTSRRHGLLVSVLAVLTLAALARFPRVRADVPAGAGPSCAPSIDGWQGVNPFGGDQSGDGELTLKDGYAADSCHLVLVGYRIRSHQADNGRVTWDHVGAVAHSDDGGVTLRVSELPDLSSLDHVAFTDALHGWATDIPATGPGHAPGQVSGLSQTVDGGETWITVPLPPEIVPGLIRESAGRLWVVTSGGHLWMSEDEALTWRLALQVTNRTPVPESDRISGKYRSPSIYDVAVAGDLVLVAAADWQSGIVLLSSDGGQTFSVSPDSDAFTTPHLAAIAPPATLMLSGFLGSLIGPPQYGVGRRSLDGGVTWLPWAPVDLPWPPSALQTWGAGSLFLVSPTEGYAAIGYDVPPADSTDPTQLPSQASAMAHTTDAGASWTLELLPPFVRSKRLDAGFSNVFASGDGVLFYVSTSGLYVRRR